jgi:tetratricopeptide (TPR) repeat protein
MPNVGQELLNVPFPEMVLKLACAIAEGQYKLDMVSCEIAKFMGDEKTAPVHLPDLTDPDGKKVIVTSLIGAGFQPTFYQFTDTIIEVKMAISMNKTTDTSVSASATGKYGQAAQAFDTCIRMNLGNKERATAYFQAGITFARLNNTLRAQEYITRALTEFERLEEKDSIIECLTERALLFKNAGRKDLAVQDLRKCLKIADGNENLLKGIQEQLASI